MFIILFLVSVSMLVGIGCTFGAFYNFEERRFSAKPNKLIIIGLICGLIVVGATCIDFVPANNAWVKWSIFSCYTILCYSYIGRKKE